MFFTLELVFSGHEITPFATTLQIFCQNCADESKLQGFLVVEVADDIVGAVLGLVVDAADVLADDAEREQLDAAEEKQQDDQRGITLNGVAPDERLDEDIYHINEGEHRDDEADDSRNAQGQTGERGDAVDGQREQLPETP